VIHKLRYAEFIMAGRLLRLGELQRSVSANLSLTAFEKSINKADSPAEYWDALLETIAGFGFVGARMQIGNERFEYGEHQRKHCWFLRIPLSHTGDYIELVREVGSPVLPAVVAPFVDLIATSLSNKLVYQKAAAASAGDEAQTVPAGI
jgi:hypothetical protein